MSLVHYQSLRNYCDYGIIQLYHPVRYSQLQLLECFAIVLMQTKVKEIRRQLFDQIQEVDFSEGFDYVPLETTPTGSQHV